MDPTRDDTISRIPAINYGGDVFARFDLRLRMLEPDRQPCSLGQSMLDRMNSGTTPLKAMAVALSAAADANNGRWDGNLS